MVSKIYLLEEYEIYILLPTRPITKIIIMDFNSRIYAQILIPKFLGLIILLQTLTMLSHFF